MHFELLKEGGSSRLKLTGDAHVSHAQRFYAAVEELLDQVGPHSIDASGVARLDVPIAQVMLAAKKASPSLRIDWSDDSELRQWFKETGMANLLVAPAV